MLVSVPLRDQLDEPVTDHEPDENARANCVPASLAATLSALTGRAYYGDELKDAVYGEAYTGATDPARYIAYVAAQGVRMWEVRGAHRRRAGGNRARNWRWATRSMALSPASGASPPRSRWWAPRRRCWRRGSNGWRGSRR